MKIKKASLNWTKNDEEQTAIVSSLKTDNKGFEVVDSLCFLASSIISKGTSSQGICLTVALGRVAIKALENIFRCVLPTEIGMVFPVTSLGSESWTLKRQDKKYIDAFEL